jgi:hypothetical protein
MANHSLARFGVLHYDPGNPEFPTLPDGVDSLHIINYGSSASLALSSPVPDDVLKRNSAAPGPKGFADWFLDGVWRQPNPVDFGNITAAKQREITLHNSGRTAVTLTAIDVSAVSGVTAVAPGLPVTIEAFDTVTLTFEAGAAGDPAFDGNVIFTVDGVDLTIRMLGRRIIMYDTLPEMPILERMSWLTDNMIAVNGKEQAFSLRRAPRSKVTINERLDNEIEIATKKNLILGAGMLRMGIQLWWQARQLTSAALTTDTVLQLDTQNMEIRNGGDLSLYLPDGSVLEVEIDSFTTSSITLSQAVGTALPLGTYAMPLTYGFMADKAQYGTYPVNLEDVSIIFDLLEYTDIGALDMTYFTTHPIDGLPIITAPLEFSGNRRAGELSQVIDRLDSRTGDISLTRTELLARWSQQVLVTCRSMADQHAWRKFLHFIRGSWRAFYVPTGTNDLPLHSDFTLGGNTFEIPSMGVQSLINGTAPRRDIVFHENGNIHYRRVNSVVDDGTKEIVTMSAVITGSGTVPKEDIKVEWLTLSRLVGDAATFKHTRLGEAELRFAIRGVIDV